MDRELYEYRARILKALAHPSRLMMVDVLSEGERCVCEFQQIVGSDMSTVSKHLAVLKAAGIVSNRKQGLQVFYRLEVTCVKCFLDCADAVVRNNALTQERVAALVR
jgi:ArsR family transcriptional regulator